MREALEGTGLGVRRGAVEHIGSTAVPGLPAKPILDVAVGLTADHDRAAVHDPLVSLGFLSGDRTGSG